MNSFDEFYAAYVGNMSAMAQQIGELQVALLLMFQLYKGEIKATDIDMEHIIELIKESVREPSNA